MLIRTMEFAIIKAVGDENMQKIDLFGMNLTDYSLREAIGITDRFMGSGSLNTILCISARMLVDAGISEEQKKWIEEGDLIVWSDAEIVKQAGITAKNRIHEVENQEYIKEFLKRLGRGKKPVYLLAESEEELGRLQGDLLFLRPDLKITGSGIIPFGGENWEDTANHINSLAPAVIISRMAFGHQERLMAEMRSFLNPAVWLALNHQMILREKQINPVKRLMDKWYRHLFQKQLENYSNQEDNDKEDS